MSELENKPTDSEAVYTKKDLIKAGLLGVIAISILFIIAIADYQMTHTTPDYLVYNGTHYPLYVTSNDLLNNTPLAIINVTDMRIDSLYFYPNQCVTKSVTAYGNRTTTRHLSVSTYISADLHTSLDLINIPTKDGALLYEMHCEIPYNATGNATIAGVGKVTQG